MTPVQNTDRVSSAAAFVAREVELFPAEVRELPVAPDVTPAEIREHLAERFSFAEPRPLDAILADVAAMMRLWTLHATHPRYFGLFNPDVHEAGVWGDALAALYNPQVGGWWHSPAACEIERHTLHFFARAMGWEVDGMTAHFTSGGSEANQTAVLAAIALRHGDSLRDGLTNPAPALRCTCRARAITPFTRLRGCRASETTPSASSTSTRDGAWMWPRSLGRSRPIAPRVGSP